MSDLNEEDRQRIEEIKAELLLSAKKSGLAKVRKRNSCSGDFVSSLPAYSDELYFSDVFEDWWISRERFAD